MTDEYTNQISVETQQFLLDRARKLQDEYWEALSHLEGAVGFEIDGSQELPSTVDELEEEE